jgi:hypothetical protein
MIVYYRPLTVAAAIEQLRPHIQVGTIKFVPCDFDVCLLTDINACLLFEGKQNFDKNRLKIVRQAKGCRDYQTTQTYKTLYKTSILEDIHFHVTDSQTPANFYKRNIQTLIKTFKGKESPYKEGSYYEYDEDEKTIYILLIHVGEGMHALAVEDNDKLLKYKSCPKCHTYM